MVIGVNVPRVRKGDFLYRVEWVRNEPVLEKFEVITGTVLSIVVRSDSGREQILVGKAVLGQYSVSPEKAVVAEFQNIARSALKHDRDSLKALKQILQLGVLIPEPSKKK